jgi:hypothetical protein
VTITKGMAPPTPVATYFISPQTRISSMCPCRGALQVPATHGYACKSSWLMWRRVRRINDVNHMLGLKPNQVP